ncbi:uncharacterized protein FRV6_00373 [Fusarium oxysporum]|uniref:Uncharacterized protein n=1 Tax=Fusarium oxysporum TaxID=5507 RepID=A0A2H3SJ57_FUSOX|nr:uncharacterized protein FRV6_00373 [Fusarium oxysporum]
MSESGRPDPTLQPGNNSKESRFSYHISGFCASNTTLAKYCVTGARLERHLRLYHHQL